MSGGEIKYADHGGGSPSEDDPPLLLIHGAGGDRYFWPPELRRKCRPRVLAPDLPGHGESSGPSEDTISGYLARLLEWLGQLEIGPLVWCGHSMGGAIALQAGLSQPDRVAGLILISTGARFCVHPQILRLTARAGDSNVAVQWLMDRAFSEQAPEHLVRLAGERLANVPLDVLHRDFLACDRFDLMGELPHIQTPALVIAGSLDQLTPPQYSQYLGANLRHARLSLIEGAGHMIMLERPTQVADKVRAFLAEI
jgi:pimeloyl-ACP methyl ester carboxylesterase